MFALGWHGVPVRFMSIVGLFFCWFGALFLRGTCVLRMARSNEVGRVLMAGLIWIDDRMWWAWAVHFYAVSANVLIAWRAGFISAVERML